ncbi:hypothetical protein GHK68_09410 [Sinorhizobium meliloti]|uniref:hypothetical protein n=1 Tax=Rhizobium meliloti TaxID=382 RepID=UPI001297EFCC|nr:hypothetical protein [Sinorhizobium meliloti]MQW42548.1 hypothetical protein [Sinorhizobium meliloti]
MLAILIVRPWEPPGEIGSDNTAVAWNTAIERLGIAPLYPPQEDFFVGDVYVTLGDPMNEIAGRQVKYPSNVYKGRGIKIGHIDMRESIKTGAPKFRFAQTKLTDGAPNQDHGRSAIPLASDPDSEINLSLVGFPAITIRNHVRAEAGLWGYLAGRKTGLTEEITIPYAESYGGSVVDGLLALDKFCSDEATAGFCQDKIARKMLSHVFGSDVNAVHDNNYVFTINLSLVTQVYLTRELKIERYRGDSLSLDAENPDSRSNTESGPTTGSSPNEASVTMQQPTEERPVIQYNELFSNRLRLSQVFRRPVAFGFRKVSFVLPRSHPIRHTGDAK